MPSLTSILTDQPISFVTGTQEIGPVTLPDSATLVEFLVTRQSAGSLTLWSSASTKMAWSIYISYDGGKTWKFEAGTGPIAGGSRKYADNSEISKDFMRLSLTPGVGRQCKAVCAVESGPLVSAVTLNVY